MKNSYNFEKKGYSGIRIIKQERTSSSPCPTRDGDSDRLEGPHCSPGFRGMRGSRSQHQAPRRPMGLLHSWHRVPSAWEGCSVATALQHFSSWFKGSLPSETRTGRKPGRLLVLWTIETDWHFPIKFPVNRQSDKPWFKKETKVFRKK